MLLVSILYSFTHQLSNSQNSFRFKILLCRIFVFIIDKFKLHIKQYILLLIHNAPKHFRRFSPICLSWLLDSILKVQRW